MPTSIAFRQRRVNASLILFAIRPTESLPLQVSPEPARPRIRVCRTTQARSGTMNVNVISKDT